jgi:uncharacterized protein (DUF983 family)
MSKNAVTDTTGWLRKVWVGATGRCPKCEHGKMFESHFQIRANCPDCGVRLQPYAGDSLGVYAVCYFFALVPAALAIIAAYFLQAPLSPIGYILLFGAVSGAVLFGFYPNMKGVWIAFVYLMTGLRPQL